MASGGLQQDQLGYMDTAAAVLSADSKGYEKMCGAGRMVTRTSRMLSSNRIDQKTPCSGSESKKSVPKKVKLNKNPMTKKIKAAFYPKMFNITNRFIHVRPS